MIINHLKQFELPGVSFPVQHLWVIFHQYSLRNDIHISAFEDGVSILGEEKNVLKFANILRWEAIQANQYPALSAIHLAICAKNDNECSSFKAIPKEVIETIITLASLLIAPHPIK